MTTAVIVQARMGSKRFPGKVLADLCGHPVLWHVLTRARRIEADQYVLATSDDPENSPIVALATELGWLTSITPDENDVLGRYHATAVGLGLQSEDIVVRITGDCPLLDPPTCNNIVGHVTNGNADYASNTIIRTMCKGEDCEAFTFAALSLAHQNATDPYDREHVTPWILRAAHLRKTPVVMPGGADFSFMNLSVDTPEDLEYVRRVMAEMQAA